MAELTEVLGSILRDVARSRVVSDMFSRDISHQYEQDPILIDFPVPRVEIEEASIQLQFAVNTVESRPVDSDAIKKAGMTKYAAKIGHDLYSHVVVQHPNRVELEKLLERKTLDLQGRFAQIVEDTMLSNRSAVDRALNGQPGELDKALAIAVDRSLRADNELWNSLKTRLLIRQISEQIDQAIGPAVEAFAQDVVASLEDADRDALSVDIAVTREELADLPEAVLSNVRLVTTIRNYEWTEVGEVSGKPTRRLRPE